MTHTEGIYVILGVGLFISGFGALVLYREFQHHFPFLPGRNVLTRRHHDIELRDLDPIQHINIRDIDLSSLPQYPQAMVNNHIPIRWDRYPLPRYSQLTENTAIGNTPPGYSQITDNLINCPLELNSWDFNSWLIFLLIIGFIFFKCLKTKSLYSMSIMFPFSFFEIDFRDSFEWKLSSYRFQISYFKIKTLTEDIIKLLYSLDDNENYSMSLSFISSYKEWENNKEKIVPLFIDDPIIINKESDPILITQFIMNRINDKGYFDINQLFKDSSINSMDPIILTVTVPIKLKI